jgi:hypothetical protein
VLSAILALFFLFSRQKISIIAFPGSSFIFCPFIEENCQVGITTYKTLFPFGNLQSQSGVLNRSNRNCLLGPGRYLL